MILLKVVVLLVLAVVTSVSAEEKKENKPKVMTTKGPVPAGHVVEKLEVRDLDIDAIVDMREDEKRKSTCSAALADKPCSRTLPTR